LWGGYEVEVDSQVTEVTLKNGDPNGYFASLNPYKGMQIRKILCLAVLSNSKYNDSDDD
jgi:hypothetical protein